MPDRWEQMWEAARAGAVQKMLGLLDGGVDIEWKHPADGWTALHVSAARYRTTCVSALLGRGANLNALNNDKCTPLHWAARNGRAAIVKLLLEAGADPSLEDNHGKTALDYAKQNNHTECIRLLENPAAVRAQVKWDRLIGLLKHLPALRDWRLRAAHNAHKPDGKGFKRSRDEFEEHANKAELSYLLAMINDHERSIGSLRESQQAIMSELKTLSDAARRRQDPPSAGGAVAEA